MPSKPSHVKLPSPAKINLFFRVLGKRPDGFHEIDSLMVKLGFSDTLDIHFTQKAGFSLRVPGYPALENQDNLLIKAARSYFEAAKLGPAHGLEILLHKHIFVAAGLGGGSSNAGVMLSALQAHFGVLSQSELHDIAAGLGSDVPFFLLKEDLARVSGRGEICRGLDITLPHTHVVLANPGLAVSTAKVYQGLDISLTCSNPNDNWRALRLASWPDIEASMDRGNDLRESAVRLEPGIAQLLSEMKDQNPLHFDLCGSGATVFGFFAKQSVAQNCAMQLQAKGYKVVCTQLGAKKAA